MLRLLCFSPYFSVTTPPIFVWLVVVAAAVAISLDIVVQDAHATKINAKTFEALQKDLHDLFARLDPTSRPSDELYRGVVGKLTLNAKERSPVALAALTKAKLIEDAKPPPIQTRSHTNKLNNKQLKADLLRCFPKSMSKKRHRIYFNYHTYLRTQRRVYAALLRMAHRCGKASFVIGLQIVDTDNKYASGLRALKRAIEGTFRNLNNEACPDKKFLYRNVVDEFAINASMHDEIVYKAFRQAKTRTIDAQHTLTMRPDHPKSNEQLKKDLLACFPLKERVDITMTEYNQTLCAAYKALLEMANDCGLAAYVKGLRVVDPTAEGHSNIDEQTQRLSDKFDAQIPVDNDADARSRPSPELLELITRELFITAYRLSIKRTEAVAMKTALDTQRPPPRLGNGEEANNATLKRILERRLRQRPHADDPDDPDDPDAFVKALYERLLAMAAACDAAGGASSTHLAKVRALTVDNDAWKNLAVLVRLDTAFKECFEEEMTESDESPSTALNEELIQLVVHHTRDVAGVMDELRTAKRQLDTARRIYGGDAYYQLLPDGDDDASKSVDTLVSELERCFVERGGVDGAARVRAIAKCALAKIYLMAARCDLDAHLRDMELTDDDAMESE